MSEPVIYGIWFPDRAGNSGGWVTDVHGHIYWLPTLGAALAQLLVLDHNIRERAEVKVIGSDGWPIP